MSVPFALAISQRELIQDPAVIEELDRWAAKLNGYLQSIEVPDAEADLNSGVDNTHPSDDVITRLALGSDVDSLDPDPAGDETDLLVLTPSGAMRTLAGIRNGYDGRQLEIIVPPSAAQILTFAHNSGNADADEVLLLTGAADLSTVANEARGLRLRYDGVERAWIQVGGSASIGAVTTGAVIEGHTQVGTDADTSEKDLVTGTLPASTLSADGDVLIVRAYGNFAANNNGKRVRVYWNGSAVADTAAQAYNDEGWQVFVIVTRTGSAAQKGHAMIMPAGVAPSPSDIKGDFFSDTADLTGTVALKITGTNSTSNANDITFEGWTVYRIGAP